MPAYSASTLAKSSQLNQARGPSAAAREARGQSAGDRQAESVKIKEMRFIINTAHSILPNVLVSTRQKETGNYCKKFP